MSRLFCVAVLLTGLAATASQGQSFGRWRVPSTPAQFFGCGHGPGHHAPIVRMPARNPMSAPRVEFASPVCSSCQFDGYTTGYENGFYPTSGMGSPSLPAQRFYFSDVSTESEFASPKTPEETLPTPAASN